MDSVRWFGGGGARTRLENSSRDLLELLRDAKADVAAVTRGMDEVGIESSVSEEEM